MEDRMEAEAIVREVDQWRDIFIGSPSALVAAGIIEAHQLPPQAGRKKGYAMFMPGGRAVPPGVSTTLWTLPGYVRVRVLPTGRCRVEISVSHEEMRRRAEAEPASVWGDVHKMRYRGTVGQLRRAGVPDAWLRGLPEPGKTRGKRKIYEGERRIAVSVGERREFFVEVTHIDYYRGYGAERYAEERRHWRLPETPGVGASTYAKIVRDRDDDDRCTLPNAVLASARQAVARVGCGIPDGYARFMLRVLDQPGRAAG
jgi:hypothetical protein